MQHTDPTPGRDRENPDPHELNRPIPRLILAVVALLLAWAIYYIATQAPGMGSSSSPDVKQVPVTESPSRAG